MPKKSPSASGETAATRKSDRAPAAKSSAAPAHGEIALRAYHIYLQRNGAPGSPLEDWKRAEQELLAESAKSKARRKSKVVPFAA